MEGIRTERVIRIHPPLEVIESVQVSHLPELNQNVLIGFTDGHGNIHRIVRRLESNLPSAMIKEIY